MEKEQVLEIFDKANAILKGHFILTSGRHSAIYMQKAKVFMHGDLTEMLCKALAQKIKTHIEQPIKYLIGPAIGGIIPAYETAKHLQLPVLWVERVQGKFSLKRFEVQPGDNVVIIDDIVTTGLSIKETIETMHAEGDNVMAAPCIIDRSAVKVDVGVPLLSLCEYEVASFAPNELPAELAKTPAIKPGSRAN